jgi:hypothetical protein
MRIRASRIFMICMIVSGLSVTPLPAQPGSCDPGWYCGAKCIDLQCWYDSQTPYTVLCFEVAGGGCGIWENHRCCADDGLF